jgi:hypothetical protein
LTFYLFLYHLDSISDWLNGLGMIGVDLPRVDNILEMFLSNNFLNTSVRILEIDKNLNKEINGSLSSFTCAKAHEQDPIWGIMTISTTFKPGLVYGI